MTPKRIYQVYQEQPKGVMSSQGYLDEIAGQWRFRVIAARNKQIVGGSQESFDSKGNGLRAARREVSLYPEGVAVVEVAE